MPARRCYPCDTNWLNNDSYELCPKCGEATTQEKYTAPLEYSKAVQIAGRWKEWHEWDAGSPCLVPSHEVADTPATRLADLELAFHSRTTPPHLENRPIFAGVRVPRPLVAA